MSDPESKYPCEEGTAEPKRHKLRKGQGQELARGVDCAIEARDQWMTDVTDWLKALRAEVTELRARLAACEKSCGSGSGGGGADAPQAMMMMLIQDPPKPPKPWP